MFSFDTSAFLDVSSRWYPLDVFPNVWQRLDELISVGHLVAVDEVLRELERGDDEIYQWAKQRSQAFQALDRDIQNAAQEVLSVFPRLVDSRTGKSFGDPFVIAHAKCRGLTIVTGEVGGTVTRPKIPNVCDHFKIRCINVVALFREQGWKF